MKYLHPTRVYIHRMQTREYYSVKMCIFLPNWLVNSHRYIACSVLRYSKYISKSSSLPEFELSKISKLFIKNYSTRKKKKIFLNARHPIDHYYLFHRPRTIPKANPNSPANKSTNKLEQTIPSNTRTRRCLRTGTKQLETPRRQKQPPPAAGRTSNRVPKIPVHSRDTGQRAPSSPETKTNLSPLYNQIHALLCYCAASLSLSKISSGKGRAAVHILGLSQSRGAGRALVELLTKRGLA